MFFVRFVNKRSGSTICQMKANFIPRVGEHIEYHNGYFEVYNITYSLPDGNNNLIPVLITVKEV